MTTTPTTTTATERDTTHRIVCLVCGGSGTDPAFLCPCEPCNGTGYKRTAVAMPTRTEHEDVTDLVAWLAEQTWSDFATSLADFHRRHGFLSPKQISSARSMQAKVLARQAERAQRTPADDSDPTPPHGTPRPTPTATVDLSNVPTGLYAVPGGDTRLKVRIDNVTSGKWTGWVFVKDGAEYGQGRKYGSQKPGQQYRGDIVDALQAIAADPAEAMAAYGRLTGTCGRCSRPLEDEVSVARGIGPVCATKMGW